ncbi:hypothetical protein ACHAXS_004177 [Conticribra weissflogii]
MPLKEATASMHTAYPLAFQQEIVNTMMKLNYGASGIDDYLKDLIQGGLVRDSIRLNKVKVVPKIFNDGEEFNGNDSSCLLRKRLRGSLTSKNNSPATTDQRCRHIDPDELSSALVKVSSGDLTNLNDSRVDFIVGGCVRDSRKLEKTKMCPKVSDVSKEKDFCHLRSVTHPHRQCKRRGYSDEVKP